MKEEDRVEKKKGRREEMQTWAEGKPPAQVGRRFAVWEPWGPPTPSATAIFEKTQTTRSKTGTCLTPSIPVHNYLLPRLFLFLSHFEAFPENVQERDVLTGEGSVPALVATGEQGRERERRGQGEHTGTWRRPVLRICTSISSVREAIE